MEDKAITRYKLAEGTQVREEDFGLLFYTRSGPRLFFISCGEVLDENFFRGNATLNQWITLKQNTCIISTARFEQLQGLLEQLTKKGVIHEC